MITDLMDLMFGCHHANLGFPMKRNKGKDIRVCLDCGSEFEYSWDAMQVVGRIETKQRKPVPLQDAEDFQYDGKMLDGLVRAVEIVEGK